jgi:hypothetical protein
MVQSLLMGTGWMASRREHNGRKVYSYDPKLEGSNLAPAGSGMEEILINVTELVTSV